MWGNTATQAYAMERVPDSMFLRLMKYYRKQIDVLISNVPVGNLPISVGDVPVQIVCHTRGLSLPLFLMMGTREDIHVSYSTLYSQNEFFQKPCWVNNIVQIASYKGTYEMDCIYKYEDFWKKVRRIF